VVPYNYNIVFLFLWKTEFCNFDRDCIESLHQLTWLVSKVVWWLGSSSSNLCILLAIMQALVLNFWVPTLSLLFNQFLLSLLPKFLCTFKSLSYCV
jgi:hypothetical protein